MDIKAGHLKKSVFAENAQIFFLVYSGPAVLSHGLFWKESGYRRDSRNIGSFLGSNENDT